MKKPLLTLAVLFSLALTQLTAQTTINTWYVIPPTSGCNGTWAIDASQFASCGSGPFQYNMNPMGCVQMTPNVVADTLFWQLCAFPCDLLVVDMMGNTCTCSTGTITDVAEQSSQHITTTYPNPATTQSGWNILLHQPGSDVTVRIFNPLGQVVVTLQNSTAEQIVHVDISTLAPGTYTAQVSVNSAAPYQQQLVVTQ